MHTYAQQNLFLCSDSLRAVHLNLQIGLSDDIVSEEAEQSSENLVVKIIRSQDI